MTRVLNLAGAAVAVVILAVGALVLLRSDSDAGTGGRLDGHDVGDGFMEVGVRSGAATSEQREAADRLWRRTRQAVARFPTVEDALAAGYVRVGDDEHLVHPEYLDDRAVLDPQRVESLIYREGSDGAGSSQLIGAMYMAPVERMAPAVGGPLTVWHYHDWRDHPRCMANGFLVAQPGRPLGEPTDSGECVTGRLVRRSPQMLHVWFHDGQVNFSTSMSGG